MKTFTGEVHEVRGVPGCWVASVLTDGKFSCRIDDVSEAGSRDDATAWLRGRLAELGAAGAAIEVRP